MHGALDACMCEHCDEKYATNVRVFFFGLLPILLPHFKNTSGRLFCCTGNTDAGNWTPDGMSAEKAEWYRYLLICRPCSS